MDQRREWERRLYAAGFAGLHWPERYGGQGRTLVEHLIASEEMGRIGAPESVNSMGKEMIGGIILQQGTETQKRRFLPAILEMREIWCQGFSEPEAGSDLAGVKTRAVLSGDEWIINGQKIWTSAAYRADWCLLLARTGLAEQKHASLTLFTVPLRTKGITMRQIERANGDPEFCQVFYDDVRIPADHTIGAVNEGWLAAVRVLEIERGTNRMYRAARFANELRHLLAACRSDAALAPLLGESYYRQRIAALFADIEVLRQHYHEAVATVSSGNKIGTLGSVIKLHWSEAHRRFTELAIEMLGHATIPESPIVRAARHRFNELYLHVQTETVQAGATEVQLDLIARRGLGLSKVD